MGLDQRCVQSPGMLVARGPSTYRKRSNPISALLIDRRGSSRVWYALPHGGTTYMDSGRVHVSSGMLLSIG